MGNNPLAADSQPEEKKTKTIQIIMKFIMKNRFLIRAMYAVAVALFFTACGSDNDGGGSSPAKEPNVNRNTDYSDAAATRTEVPHLQGGNSQFIAYRPEFGISDSRFSCYARFPTGAYYICPPNNMDGKMQNCKVQMKFTL